MTRYSLLAAAAAVAMLPPLAAAQSMGGMAMPGMKMPAKPAAKPKPKPKPKTAARKTARKAATSKPIPRAPTAPAPSDPMAGMEMSRPMPPAAQSMPGMDMTAPAGPAAAPQPKAPAMPGTDMSAPGPAAPAGPMAGMPMPAGQAMPGMAGMKGMRRPMRPAPGCTDIADPGPDGIVAGAVRCLPGEGSGTSRLPAIGGAMTGLHLMSGDWMLMLHGYAWATYTDQSGPRGRSEAFVTSMGMIDARREFGGGVGLQLRSMVSLDALMGKRGYPSLLATGETADGVTPLVDRQHPHDLFMELSARVDVPVGGGWNAYLYGGPVAEPALGPSAFMHRGSARYLPLAPISHHWFDSTHISYGVITFGISDPRWQFEGSAFRGREPDQNRWDIETPKLDSWSLRATFNPSPAWSAQISYGRLKSPEALEPNVDEARTTASVQYAQAGVSVLLGFAIKNRLPGRSLTAFIGEANWDISKRHSLFGRVENLANDELFPLPADPRHDRPFRVTRAELGYAYRVPLSDKAAVAIGGSGFVIAKPKALDSAYGKAPAGFTGFVKLSLGG